MGPALEGSEDSIGQLNAWKRWLSQEECWKLARDAYVKWLRESSLEKNILHQWGLIIVRMHWQAARRHDFKLYQLTSFTLRHLANKWCYVIEPQFTKSQVFKRYRVQKHCFNKWVSQWHTCLMFSRRYNLTISHTDGVSIACHPCSSFSFVILELQINI